MEHKAYSLLTEKAVSEDEDFVYIKGIASSPTVDRMGDIVEPLGAKFKTPMPLLMYHDHHMPVGNMTFAKPSAKGIPFEAKIPRVKESGTVKDRVEEAIHSLKYGLISAVSIGFSAVEGQVERLKGGGLRFMEWEWYELSLVVVPAQADAVIQMVRSLDKSGRNPAIGKKSVSGSPVSLTKSPGATGIKLSALPVGAVKLIGDPK